MHDDDFACYCFGVTVGEVRQAIRKHELRDVEAITCETHACLGCRTCRPDLEAILAEELAAAAGRATPRTPSCPSQR